MKKIVILMLLYFSFTLHSSEQPEEKIDQPEFITGAPFGEIESNFQKNILETVDTFFSSVTEGQKEEHESLLSRRKRAILIARYNKRIGALKATLLKKITHINAVFEKEIDDKKVEFTQQEGAENIIRVHYSKTSILDSHELRLKLILASLDKAYKQVIKLLGQLEERLDTYYLTRLEHHIVEAYSVVAPQIQSESHTYTDAILKADSIVPLTDS